MASAAATLEGVVSHYEQSQGKGYIKFDDPETGANREIFLQKSHLHAGIGELWGGELVRFEVVAGVSRGKIQALVREKIDRLALPSEKLLNKATTAKTKGDRKAARRGKGPATKEVRILKRPPRIAEERVAKPPPSLPPSAEPAPRGAVEEAPQEKLESPLSSVRRKLPLPPSAEPAPRGAVEEAPQEKLEPLSSVRRKLEALRGPGGRAVSE